MWRDVVELRASMCGVPLPGVLARSEPPRGFRRLNTWSPVSTRVPPSSGRTSSVLGATKRPAPMISSAPLVL